MHRHPLIYMRGIKSDDLLAIVNFLYSGKANVYQENLDSFLTIAEELQLRGLVGESDTDRRANSEDSGLKSSPKESKSLCTIYCLQFPVYFLLYIIFFIPFIGINIKPPSIRLSSRHALPAIVSPRGFYLLSNTYYLPLTFYYLLFTFYVIQFTDINIKPPSFRLCSRHALPAIVSPRGFYLLSNIYYSPLTFYYLLFTFYVIQFTDINIKPPSFRLCSRHALPAIVSPRGFYLGSACLAAT